MNKPCEYCGHDLPLGVDLGTRRVRSYHFERCPVRLAQKAEQQPTESENQQEWLDAFVLRAGFGHGWENLESWARRMAEQAYEERNTR